MINTITEKIQENHSYVVQCATCHVHQWRRKGERPGTELLVLVRLNGFSCSLFRVLRTVRERKFASTSKMAPCWRIGCISVSPLCDWLMGATLIFMLSLLTPLCRRHYIFSVSAVTFQISLHQVHIFLYTNWRQSNERTQRRDWDSKPVTSPCYDKQHVCTYLQSFSH